MPVELPQWVVRDIVANQQREWEPRLKALDPELRLIPPFQNPPHPAMLPDRWHLARFTDMPGQESIIPIVGSNGEFREMDEGMFEALKRRDLQSPRSLEAARVERKKRQAAHDWAKRKAKEDRVGDLADRIETGERTSIRVTKEI